MQVVELELPPVPDFRPFGRSDTLHVSSVIKDIDLRLKMSNYPDGGFNLGLAADLGFLWEDILSWFWGERMATRPGEVERDGITGSPDGISSDEKGIYLVEYKLTWMSSAKSEPQDVWRWMTQAKAYCAMCDLDSMEFQVLYLNADYKWKDVPSRRRLRIYFSEQEIEENWAMITNHARYMREKGSISNGD